MNGSLFDYWQRKYSGVSGLDGAAQLKAAFEKLPGIDGVLSQATREHLKLSEIRPLIDQARTGSAKSEASVPSSAPRVIPLPGNVQTSSSSKAEKPSFIKGLVSRFKVRRERVKKESDGSAEAPAKSGSKLKLIGIGAGVLVLAVVGILAVRNISPGSATPDITFDIPTAPSLVKGPEEGVVVGGSGTVSDVASARPEKKARTPFLMYAPKSIPDLFNSPDSNFLVFVGVLILMIVLAKQERFAEQQQTDWRVIRIGYILVAIGLLFSAVIAVVLTHFVKYVVGVTVEIEPLLIQVTFLFAALVAFVTASITGKVDWTPVSVGLFTMGGFLIALNPDGPGRITGTILILVGIAVHVFELTTQQGTAGALGLVLVGLPLFVAGRFGFEALFNLLGNASLPTGSDAGSVFLAWLALGAYNGRILWSTVLSLVIGFSVASSVASLIFPPIAKMLPQGGQMVGNFVPTEDTPRIDAVVAFLMGVVCFWLLAGHF